MWFDVANYWEINADNPGRIEYDYIRFYLKGTNHLNYDANITLAADASGNSEVIVTNMPENENNVPNGSGYLAVSYTHRGDDLLHEYEKSSSDAVFLDIDIPDMNGFQIAEALQKNNSNAIIVFITSYEDKV